MMGLLIGAPAYGDEPDPAPRAMDQADRQGFSKKAEKAGRVAEQALQKRSEIPVEDTEKSSQPDEDKKNEVYFHRTSR